MKYDYSTDTYSYDTYDIIVACGLGLVAGFLIGLAFNLAIIVQP